MNKYYLQYPINLDCNLHCHYCFHTDARQKSWSRGFDLADYFQWRKSHFSPNDEFLICFHGGETTAKKNIDDIVTYLDIFALDRAEILTNGLGLLTAYTSLLPFKNRIERIVCTYHRSVIKNYADQVQFVTNVIWLRDQGFNVVVKELLIHGNMGGIEHDKITWDENGIPVIVSDLKTNVRLLNDYNKVELAFISPEFKHQGETCRCHEGYKNIIIRGGWNGGDVLACWHDGCVIGNILDNTFNPDYKIARAENGAIDICEVPLVYRGTFPKDIYNKECAILEGVQI